MLALAEADDRIRAAFVYGSHATGSADRFSDLDIGLVTTDDDFDDVVADGDALVRKLGEPVFLDHFGNPAQLHVIFADGTALELIIDRESELTFEGPHRVLVDKAGVSERAAGRPGRTPESSDVPAQVRQRIQGFWHDVDHLVTALGRGNTWWAFGQLDELRRMVLNLARLEIGLEPDDEASGRSTGPSSPIGSPGSKRPLLRWTSDRCATRALPSSTCTARLRPRSRPAMASSTRRSWIDSCLIACAASKRFG